MLVRYASSSLRTIKIEEIGVLNFHTTPMALVKAKAAQLFIDSVEVIKVPIL